MPDKFIAVTDEFFVSPQLTTDDIAAAASAGFNLIINNRPDGEALGQPKSEDLETAAQKAGIAYAHIPVGGAGITPDHLEAHLKTRENHPGKVLTFCRTGMRSIFLGAYSAAKAGVSVDEIVAKAEAAGYDVSAHRPTLEALAKDAA